MKKPSWGRLALLIAALVVIAIIRSIGEQQNAPMSSSTTGVQRQGGSSSSAASDASGDSAIASAFRDRRSDVWVESSGVVEKLLRDDNEGSRHQKMIVRLESGQTVLISHNIDLAKRVPAREGDALTFRGEYEWNDRGGVVHWTHHDPQGRHDGGYLSHNGVTYR